MKDDEDETTEGTTGRGEEYLFDRSGVVDPEVARLEAELLPLRYAGVDPKERARRARLARSEPQRAPAVTMDRGDRSRVRTAAFIACVALAAASFAVIRGSLEWSHRLPRELSLPATGLPAPPSGQLLAVTRVAGAPHIDERAIKGDAELGIGAWLETDETSRADIALLDIGRVHVDPGSRLRLVAITPKEQRLELARGSISAIVVAPPRLFIIDTPAARATDLGCAYRLEVDRDGGGVLRVTSGAVELDGNGVTSWVPAGAVCETRSHQGPGVPYYEDALDALKAALRRFDGETEHSTPGVIEEVLSASRRRDTLTLWHVRERTKGDVRDAVTNRIRELVPDATFDGRSVSEAVSHW